MSMLSQEEFRFLQAGMEMNEEWNKAIASLYTDKALLNFTADIRIVVGDKIFLAHRWILASQSRALREKFDTDVRKKEMVEITIETRETFTAKAVEAAIRYCYNGYVDEDELSEALKMAIMKVAHYYDLRDLEEDMKASLSSKNPTEELNTEGTSGTETGKNGSEPTDQERARILMLNRNKKISLLSHFPHTADCAIEADDNDTSFVHKCLLMAHSIHFRKLFTDPESKAYKGEVRVETIPYALIAYCFSGYNDGFTNELIGGSTEGMLQLANEYIAPGMKSLLEERFIKELDKDNVLKLAEIAEDHKAEKLMKACIDYIAKDGSVEGNKKWMKLEKKKNAALAVELLHGVNWILGKEKLARAAEMLRQANKDLREGN